MTSTFQDSAVAWLAFGLSLLLVALYEGWVLWVGRRQPRRMARYAHARMRADWAAALSQRPGFEIVAVQTLRNSLMSATIGASTAALALMGTITLAGGTFVEGMAHLRNDGGSSLRPVLEALLMLALFASYVCSSMAMRYYNHAGFVMSMPALSEERRPLEPMARSYVERAGLLYSWGLRCFLMVAPLVAGIVNPLLMPVMTAVLVAVLWYFDRPAQPD
jgi:uncharacterized membrane protein